MANLPSTLVLLAALFSLPALAQIPAGSPPDVVTSCPHHNNAGKCAHKSGYHGHGKSDSKGHGYGKGMDALHKRMEQLDLSDSQKQELAALLRMYQPRFKDLQKRGAAGRQQLFRTAPGAPEYSALVDEVAAEAARTASEVVVLLGELQSNAYALLTPEQQQKWQTLKLDGLERYKQRRQQWSEKRQQRRENRKKRGQTD